MSTPKNATTRKARTNRATKAQQAAEVLAAPVDETPAPLPKLEDVLAEHIATKDDEKPEVGKYDHDRRVQGVKEFAQVHYNDGAGWDVVLEAMEDEDIYQIVKRACSEAGAIRKMAAHLAPRAEFAAEVRSA